MYDALCPDDIGLRRPRLRIVSHAIRRFPMNRSILSVFLALFFISDVYAAQSTVVDAEGSACMGDERSRKQTEQAALTEAKKKAVEFTMTYLKSETDIKNFVLEKDLVSAFASANLRIVQELDKAWYKDPASGDCYRIKVKVEVIPDEKAMSTLAKSPAAPDDPGAPLSIRVWTDKKDYKSGEKIRVYLKGNKPFYARVVYKDAGGGLVQILPNPFRTASYFNGGTIYEIPAGEDKFNLEVSAPFGEENIIVYASTAPLGEIGLKAEGGVYQVQTKTEDVGVRTRGVRLTEKGAGASSGVSEFSETSAKVSTNKE